MMKTSIISIGLFLMGFTCVCASGAWEIINGEEIINGNGDKITSERTVSSFSEIKTTSVNINHTGIDGKGMLRIHSSREYRVSMNIDSNLEQYIEIANEGSTLKIETKRKIADDFIVDIYCPSIAGITIGNRTDVEFVDKMITPSLAININGAGDIEGAIECDSFIANFNGAGSIEISGTSNDADVNINGVGNFDGYEFRINNGAFKINGAGSIECWVIENLMANISGVGSIRYRGEPKINSSRNGIGSIKKAR
jgi:hypothetical protein